MRTLRFWISPLPVGAEFSALLAAALVVLVALAILAHRARAIPGPLTPGERAHAILSAARRWATALAVPVVAGALLVLLGFGLFPLRRPYALVLISRAHVPGDMRPELCKTPTDRADEAFGDPSRWQVLDLGPIVDAILDHYLGAPETWDLDVPANRRILQETVRAVFGEVSSARLASPGDAGEPIESTTARYQNVDRRLIESVEMSVLTLAAGAYNVREIRVRAGQAYDSRLSWRVAQDVLAARDQDLLLCAVGDPRPTNTLRISQLAEAHLAEDGSLSFWMIIEGEFVPGAHDARFRLDVTTRSTTTAAASVPLDVIVDRDDLGGRIVHCPGSRCVRPTNVAEAKSLHAVYAAASSSPATSARLAAQRVGDAADVSTLVMPQAPHRSPPALAMGGSSTRWQALFQDVATTLAMAPLRTGLAARGLEVPRITAPSAVDARAFLLVTEGGVVVARDAATARRVAEERLGPPAKGSEWRGARVDLGPVDSFSWRGLPVAPSIKPDAIGGAEVMATAQHFIGSPWQVQPLKDERPLVIAVPGASPAVVIGVPAAARVIDPSDPRYDPFVSLALVDTISWAVQFVTVGTSDVSPAARFGMTEGIGAGALAEPLVQDGDIQQVLDVQLLHLDLLVAALLGAYVLATAVVLRRARS